MPIDDVAGGFVLSDVDHRARRVAVDGQSLPADSVRLSMAGNCRRPIPARSESGGSGRSSAEICLHGPVRRCSTKLQVKGGGVPPLKTGVVGNRAERIVAG